MFTRSLLDAPRRLVGVQVLSPLGVLPGRQRQGIGSALVRHGLKIMAGRAVPLVGARSVVSIRIEVVLPAPFGPRKPTSSPSDTLRSMPRTASTGGFPRTVNERASPCVSIINTGAKYDSETFQKAVGLNGVGQKAVNALSLTYRAQAIREGETKVVDFEKGRRLVSE